jgi:glycogen synthase
MTADTVGGVWTYAVDLARALTGEGIEVALATLGGRVSPAQRSDAREAATLGVFESSFRLPWMDQPWDDVRATRHWLLELSSHLQPDVIHLNDPVHASPHYHVPTLAVGHSCVLSWWQSVLNTAAPSSWNRYRREMKQGLATAECVVAPSRFMLNALRQHYGVARGRVIANGRDGSRLSPRNKENIVFSAGRVWDAAKNLMALDQVALGLEWPVYVAGEQQEPGGGPAVEGTHLRMLGRLSPDAVADWLSRSAIYAFPARYEPFGLSVLEAALSGCALVLSDIPTLREQWDGKAVFVGLDDPGTLRTAIEALIEDANLRHTLAMRARRHALTLTPRRMALAYADIYTALQSRRTPISQERACAS